MWSVGDNYNCDILLPKAAIALGSYFVIVQDEGKFYFKDCTDIDIENAPCIKVGKIVNGEEDDVVNEIQPNDIISFFNNTLYVIKKISENMLEMSLVKEISPETSD